MPVCILLIGVSETSDSGLKRQAERNELANAILQTQDPLLRFQVSSLCYM